MMPFNLLFEGNDFFSNPIEIFDQTKKKLEPIQVSEDKNKPKDYYKLPNVSVTVTRLGEGKKDKPDKKDGPEQVGPIGPIFPDFPSMTPLLQPLKPWTSFPTIDLKPMDFPKFMPSEFDSIFAVKNKNVNQSDF
jgi:hypothetical protein